jgi:hypothetical protein
MGWVVRITPRPRFSPWERGTGYPLYRRLGGPQSRSGQRIEEKSLASAGDRTSIARSSSHNQTLYWVTRLTCYCCYLWLLLQCHQSQQPEVNCHTVVHSHHDNVSAVSLVRKQRLPEFPNSKHFQRQQLAAWDKQAICRRTMEVWLVCVLGHGDCTAPLIQQLTTSAERCGL